MEHLWSLAGATGGNRSQTGRARKPLKQADRQPVAAHGNRFAAHGKEGVDVRFRPESSLAQLLPEAAGRRFDPCPAHSL